MSSEQDDWDYFDGYVPKAIDFSQSILKNKSEMKTATYAVFNSLNSVNEGKISIEMAWRSFENFWNSIFIYYPHPTKDQINEVRSKHDDIVWLNVEEYQIFVSKVLESSIKN